MLQVWRAFLESVAGALVSASATAAAALLCLPLGKRVVRRASPWSMPLSDIGSGFAAGALLADVVFHLLPRCFAGAEVAAHHESVHHHAHDHVTAGGMLTGLVTFFLLEKFVQWLHLSATPNATVEATADGKRSASSASKAPVAPVGWLNLIADGVHNFVDGLAIAAAFLTQRRNGIITTVAVWLHELPQEISDYLVLVQAGFTPFRALYLNLVCSLSAVAGALVVFSGYWMLGYRLGESLDASVPMMLASVQRRVVPFAAGGLLYLATTNLLSQMQQTVPFFAPVHQGATKPFASPRRKHMQRTLWQMTGLVSGILCVLATEHIC
jgi:zinc and cadmium transporter